MTDLRNLIASSVPYIPTLIALYAIIKLLSSGLSILAKAISTLILIALSYWSVMYLLSIF